MTHSFRPQKKLISLVLAVLIAFTGILPATSAFAADGVEGYYDIELFYKDSNTIVPTYIDDTAEEKKTYIEYMVEGEELNLTYKLIDTEMPDNGYIKWYSETPTLVDVTQEGVVKAFDSSKGAVIHTWIDNEVKTIPLVGSIMAKAIEKALFNEYVDVDTMDTEAIVDIVEGLFGSDSPLAKWVESYKGELIDSLRYYLDNINSNIHVQLFAADGTLLDDDYVQICVLKNEEWYANFLPNGTHITNKSQINTTVAKGSTVQIYAVTTPVRLKYGVVYSVKSSSIFDKGKVVATVDDSGLVTFKNTGTVTIMVSPDTEQIIQGILELVNYIYKLENTGTINTDKVADILIKYVGLDINRTVLAAILDVCFAIKDIVGDAADPVQLTATAIEIISNLVLQFVYNDTITFNVVEAQPLTDFQIEGANTVKEGSQIQLEITNIVPEVGDTSDITWSSSDPSIASVDPVTGVITGRDAGRALSKQQCTIYATSAANNVQKSYVITVTGKAGKNYLSDVEIQGPQMLQMGDEADYSYSVFPKRTAESDSLYISWGIQNGVDEEENPIYIWADSETPADNGIGVIDSSGHYTAYGGGECTIAVKATTGYYISNGSFYEVSSFIGTLDVKNGIPIDDITINVSKATGIASSLKQPVTVNINGEDYTYVTIKAGTQYAGLGAVVDAVITPADASNQNLRWVVDNGYYNYKDNISEDTHSVTVKQNVGHETADTFNIYAVSEDGRVKSNTITVCVAKNDASSNTILNKPIELVNGYQTEAVHKIDFDKSTDGTYSACYKCNWYSSDESVFTVQAKNNDNRDAVITGVDVGVATLYCVSADSGKMDTCQVTVYPDKDRLRSIVNLCDKTVVKRTKDNKTLYKDYMNKLDLAYYVLYDEPLASQTTCDTYANELLYAFYKLGGFVGIAGLDILATGKKPLESDYVSVKVGSTTNYTKYSYDFDYEIYPANSMYSSIKWTSSNPDIITVDQNGKCKPVNNDPCAAKITCTVTDYMGTEISESAYIAFARNQVTGVTLDKTEIIGGNIGETQTLKATVLPNSITGGANCKDVFWSSSDESIATVDQNGVVSFLRGGDCLIYCTTFDGGYTAQCSVNVVTNYKNLQNLINQYNDLSLNSVNYYPDSWGEFINKMTAAQDMINRGGYSQDEVDKMYSELENSYKSLQKYNYLQKIELYLDGEATKEFYQYDLSLLSEGISYKNANLNLNVRLYPNNASYKDVKWESSTTNISVTSDGVCSPTVNESCYGMITCTVSDHYGNVFTDSVWVSFSYVPVTALVLSKDNISGPIGETCQLACTVEPTGSSLLHIAAASIQDYFWESDDENIATVDETGLVTFVNAGSTIVRAVSYDGGITGECIVSSEGDRSLLKKALDDYKDIDYTQYEYNCGVAFREAYAAAEEALVDRTLSQDQIDEAAGNLMNAYASMIENPYIKTESITLKYSNIKRDLVNKKTTVASGVVSSSDALSIDLSSKYSNYNNYNDSAITAEPYPSNAMYKSITWSVDDSSQMDKPSIDNSKITLTPKERNDGAWAKITVKIVDHYDREISRTIYVSMSDKVCSGFDITDGTQTIYATAEPKQLAYTVSGSPEFSTVFWSSSDENVVTVDANGIVTPVDKGTAEITGKTLDGGYSDTVTIQVLTDFTTLASKNSEYNHLIENVKDSYTYTEDSLKALTVCVAEATTMVNEGKATQAEVNAMVEKLDAAYHSLIDYVPVNSIKLTAYEEDNVNVTVVKEGFIRSTNALLNGKYVQLSPVFNTENAVYTSINWECSGNNNITVDQNGLVTNKSAQAGVAKVTCTVTNINNETYSAECYVSFVRYGATDVSFSDEKVFGAPSQTVTLSPTVTNTNNSNLASATVRLCDYTSSDENIATVDENGVVTFISQGSATITATTRDGGYTATIIAYTTWDTTALKAAIDEAAAIDYMDYAYEYGTAFKTVYDNALEVYANVYATQEEIDTACEVLILAKNDLEGHEFISPVISVKQNGEVVENNGIVLVDDNNVAVLDISLNDGAMVKSVSWSVSASTGADAVVNDSNQLVITKTADEADVTVAITAVDDYDREVTAEYSFKVLYQVVNAESIILTADGEELADGQKIVRSCGGTYTKYSPITIGYIAVPGNANAIADVTYTSSAATYVTVDKNGVIELTTGGKLRSSNNANITCTVTNSDGTTVSKTVNVTITRA